MQRVQEQRQEEAYDRQRDEVGLNAWYQPPGAASAQQQQQELLLQSDQQRQHD
jgi:hypothetical protein